MISRPLFTLALALPAFTINSQTPAARPQQQSAADVPIVLTLQKRASIGGSADAVFAPATLFAGDVATDGAGRIYVLDRMESVVRVYGANGKPISTIGRKGGGPGEFSEGREIGVSPDGVVVVADNAKHAFVRFDARGKPLPELTMRGLGIVQRILSTNGTKMVLSATARDTDVVMRLDGEKVDRLSVFPPHVQKDVPAFNVCGLRGSSQSPLLSDQLIAAANNNLVVTNQTSQFVLNIYEAGKPPRQLTRNRQPERLTLSTAREILGDSQLVYVGSNMKRCAVPTEAIAKEAGIASVVPTYERLAVDQTGNIWALRATPKKKAHLVDVFSTTGAYRGTAAIGAVTPIAFLADGSVLSLETDADDAPIIVIYSVKK